MDHNQQLAYVRAYKKIRSPIALEKLEASLQKLFDWAERRYSHYLDDGEPTDLAREALVFAIERFDEGRVVNFPPYVQAMVNLRILNAIRERERQGPRPVLRNAMREAGRSVELS